MKRLFIFVLVFAAGVSLQANSIAFRLPHDEFGQWKKIVDHIKENGKAFKVWIHEFGSVEQERIVVVDSPYKESENPSIERAIHMVLLPMKIEGALCEVVQKNDNEAVVKWELNNEKLCFCKLIAEPDALHSISYFYKGRDVSKVDQNKWLGFIKKAVLSRE